MSKLGGKEGIRKQDALTVYRYARLLAGTGTGSKHRRFGQIRAYTPSQSECAQGLAKEGPKGGLALHEYTWNDFRREHLELQDPGDSETTRLHREEARADYARTVKQLRRAPACRSCPPWSIPGRFWLLLMWPTFLRKGKRRFDALGCKPPAEATRRCDAALVVSSRSLGWVIPKPGKVGFESCRLVHGMCDFWKAWHRGLSGVNEARITVVLLWIPTSTSEVGSGGFTPGTGSTLSTREHLIC